MGEVEDQKDAEVVVGYRHEEEGRTARTLEVVEQCVEVQQWQKTQMSSYHVDNNQEDGGEVVMEVGVVVTTRDVEEVEISDVEAMIFDVFDQ